MGTTTEWVPTAPEVGAKMIMVVLIEWLGVALVVMWICDTNYISMH